MTARRFSPILAALALAGAGQQRLAELKTKSLGPWPGEAQRSGRIDIRPFAEAAREVTIGDDQGRPVGPDVGGQQRLAGERDVCERPILIRPEKTPQRRAEQKDRRRQRARAKARKGWS